MPLRYNKNVPKDIEKIYSHYQFESGDELAERFYENVRRIIQQIEQNPDIFFTLKKIHIQRANVQKFPVNILFRKTKTGVRILCVRHERRHPRHGTNRT